MRRTGGHLGALRRAAVGLFLLAECLVPAGKTHPIRSAPRLTSVGRDCPRAPDRVSVRRNYGRFDTVARNRLSVIQLRTDVTNAVSSRRYSANSRKRPPLMASATRWAPCSSGLSEVSSTWFSSSPRSEN